MKRTKNGGHVSRKRNVQDSYSSNVTKKIQVHTAQGDGYQMIVVNVEYVAHHMQEVVFVLGAFQN